MHVGIDIHGVITAYPEIFSKLSQNLINHGHCVSIITGQSWAEVWHKVDEAGVVYSHHFSIVDYHKNLGTKMWQNERGRWFLDEIEWNRSKGDYINRMKIDVHFDDSLIYANFIPDTCTFILVPKKNFVLMDFIKMG